MHCLAALLAAALTLAWGLPAHALKLVAPVDKTVVQGSSVRVHGFGQQGSEVRVRVEGGGKASEASARLDAGSIVEITVPLSPGLNRITVGRETREVFRATGAEPAPPGFRPQRIHGGDISRCSSCHEPDQSLRAGGYPGVCLSCHEVSSANPAHREGPERNLHFRANISRCNRCHDAHAAPDSKLLKGAAQELCTACHPGYAAGDGTHAAYDEGGCAACHDPHFSGFPKILTGAMPGPCEACHDQGKGAAGAKLHARVGGERACSTCHDPHGRQSGLLRQGAEALCTSCHAEVTKKGHGRELSECTACHDPHAAMGSGLVRKDVGERCAECHDDVAKGKTIHAPVVQGCRGCHNPHEEEGTAAAATRCGACHDPARSSQMASLHGGLTLAPETCSTCHPAHASSTDRLVRGALHFPLTQGKCSVCHGKGSGLKLKTSEAVQACRVCHPFESMMAAKGERIHEPVADGECMACHDPHLSAIKGLLRAAEARVCGECHSVSQKGAGRQPHSAAEDCSGCHRPHGGGEGKFLVASPRALCAACHDVPKQDAAHTHAALDEGCLHCHDPHGGFSGASLRMPERDLCVGCHESPPPRHSYAADEKCSTCHEPHASPNPHLLRGERSAAAPASGPVAR